MEQVIRIHPADNVEVLLVEQDGIPVGHKRAIRAIAKGEPVIKYGYPIGEASCDIAAGEWVHSHNLKTRLSGQLTYAYHPIPDTSSPRVPCTFQGYRRSDGKVGIRNEVWIIPTVGCVNAIAKQIETEAQQFLTPELDGIFAYSHPYGCSQLGEDHLTTQKALCGLIRNPNAGGVLVLGLGCENNQIADLKKVLGDYDEDRVKFLICQECEDEVAEALRILKDLCARASGFRREECSASDLVIGLKCGGSDGFSGITANPLLGRLTDAVTAMGGISILTEVPEMFGAETLLMDRCKDSETFEKTVSLINNFKEYFLSHGQPVGENPSPGNKAGGITTLEEKSLGCVQKGGQAAVKGVLDYGEPVREKGLNLLKAPGNDLVASAALAFSGAQMVLFTTGRGTPFGCPVPTVKISSNSELAARKSKWIDFDAGRLLHGESMDDLAEEFLEYILDLASGKIRAHSEALDKRDLAIFKDGVTL
ncbi:MAG: UxaA family hydrolase [Candidatus Merdivicinus sp.]|jgi:altronate hydrolase